MQLDARAAGSEGRVTEGIAGYDEIVDAFAGRYAIAKCAMNAFIGSAGARVNSRNTMVRRRTATVIPQSYKNFSGLTISFGRHRRLQGRAGTICNMANGCLASKPTIRGPISQEVRVAVGQFSSPTHAVRKLRVLHSPRTLRVHVGHAGDLAPLCHRWARLMGVVGRDHIFCYSMRRAAISVVGWTVGGGVETALAQTLRRRGR